MSRLRSMQVRVKRLERMLAPPRTIDVEVVRRIVGPPFQDLEDQDLKDLDQDVPQEVRYVVTIPAAPPKR